VWGSNSSHQLAEGSMDKILIPKLASSFGNAQQVTYDSITLTQAELAHKELRVIMFQLALSKIIHRNANLYIFLKFLDQIGRP
jgi:hypothetical protein